MIVEGGRTYIRTLRALHGGGRGRVDPAAPERLGRALTMADLRPPSLPAGAILCLRRVRDPRPGAFRPGSPGGDLRPPPDWERAARAALDSAVRSAARPALGAVPASAEAVLFADRAELLACLARDVGEGRAGLQWWWRGLLRGADPARACTDAWLEAPEYAPAALDALAHGGWAAAFVRSLPPGAARSLTRRLAEAFALPDLRAALDAPTEQHDRVYQAGREPGPLGAPDTGMGDDSARVEPSRPGGAPLPPGRPAPEPRARSGARSAARPAPDPPWRPWVPASEERGLDLDGRALLGIALLLRRAPSAVRAPLFAPAVRDWRHWQDADESADTSAQAVTTAAGADRSTAVPPVAFAGDAPASSALPDTPAPSAGIGAEASPGTSLAPVAPSPTTDSLAAAGTDRSVPGSMTGGPASPQPMPAAPPPLAGRRPVATLPLDTQLAGETDLGGVFYLLNLGLALGLYGDFTTPLRSGIALSPWDFVALLARRLLGEEVAADPVWPLLALLAGREPYEPPGRGFDPPAEWRLPPEWLAPFAGEGPWRWEATGGRLVLDHPTGFPILDLPIDAGDPARQLRRALRAYPGRPPVRARRRPASAASHSGTQEPRNPGTPLDRWLDWLAPYVRARLARAPGLAERGDPPHLLCRGRARVVATATHLDVTFRLADLPVEVRLAGLDRDPGWVPAAGRFVAFHYES